MRQIDTALLKKRVGKRWLTLLEDITSELYEAIHHHGRHVACPVHNGRNGDGFRLFPDAETTGGGVCNTCGKFHDGIALLMWLKGWSFLEAVDAIEEWLMDQEELGLNRDEDCVPPAASATPENRSWVATYIDRTLDRTVFAHPRLDAYYRHRGLSIPPSPVLGLVHNERYKDDFEDDYLPAMVGFFQAPDGEVVCVHRTFLDSGGTGKADVDHPKKFSPVLFRGGLTGAAIRLRDHSEVLGVSEGIETAEAVYQATGIPTWACGSAHGLESFIPPEGVTKIAIWADHDQHGVGQLAGARLAQRLYDMGITVKLLIPRELDQDWLDVLLCYDKQRLRDAARRARAYTISRSNRALPSLDELAEVLS
ncbi:toprim domain-containing protein [Geomonas nitrogeniifigens]|uniref:DUF7146 domain-containing protein n=1 Tax=Geomonas diazotrophica TaxID=2843197 RepID=UPI001C2C67FF|nr:toprim domain-containing protein [Geomonas nitrogeniifigens]QXE87391.1 toprim domain-containing protein [Geomonas nitrogeniifigens]